MQIKTEEVLSDLIHKIIDISGTNIWKCYQCGKCSAGCPMVDFMELLPHQVIRLAQIGKWKEICEANTAWICAACLTCSVRCPRGIKIAEVMEALRQVVLRNRLSNKRLNISEERIRRLPPIALISAYRKILE
ncbi:4Fe-4S dicluster domain-containing protein [Candidatus Sumerlaeota bacterium]|nr:4Fe-4S dicluster domain-containing protein [Candidatus Sumerlaeota bacterium]